MTDGLMFGFLVAVIAGLGWMGLWPFPAWYWDPQFYDSRLAKELRENGGDS